MLEKSFGFSAESVINFHNMSLNEFIEWMFQQVKSEVKIDRIALMRWDNEKRKLLLIKGSGHHLPIHGLPLDIDGSDVKNIINGGISLRPTEKVGFDAFYGFMSPDMIKEAMIHMAIAIDDTKNPRDFHEYEHLKDLMEWFVTLYNHKKIQIKEAHEQENRSLTDYRTNLPNDRGIDQAATHQISKLLNKEIDTLSFAIIDLDKLKLANDTRGHKFGDTYVQALVQTLRDKRLFVGRYGGDEFIVLAEMPADSLAKIIKTKQQQFVNKNIGGGTQPYYGSFCAGITEIIINNRKTSQEILGEVFQRADEALYQAKNSSNHNNMIIVAKSGPK